MKKLITLIIAIIAMIGMNTVSPSKPAETPVIESTSAVIETVKEEPTKTEETQAEPSMAVTEESKTKPAETEPVITEPKQKPKAQTEKPEEQKQETPPAETENNESGGIVIGDPTPTQTYSCGVAGHHCTGPETHSYICELERKGCEYCGSHTCPSFYAVDEWGQGCYTPSMPEIRYSRRSGMVLPDLRKEMRRRQKRHLRSVYFRLHLPELRRTGQSVDLPLLWITQ